MISSLVKLVHNVIAVPLLVPLLSAIKSATPVLQASRIISARNHVRRLSNLHQEFARLMTRPSRVEPAQRLLEAADSVAGKKEENDRRADVGRSGWPGNNS